MILFNPTVFFIIVTMGCLGAVTGMLGSFVFLRKQGMLADAVAHAALPGTVVSFLFFECSNPWILGFGGFCSALLGVALIELVTYATSLKRDAAIGVTLSVFFGAGLVFLTQAQKNSVEGQALLHRLFFGNAALLSGSDFQLILAMSVLLVAFVFLWGKRLYLAIFDPTYSHTIGIRVYFLYALLMAAVVIIMTIGLQTVGGILMSSLLLVPATAARPWCHTYTTFVVVGAFFGAASAVIGSVGSALIERMPTGPAIVVVLAGVMIGSLIGKTLLMRYRARC